jgi:hypothetical protein
VAAQQAQQAANDPLTKIQERELSVKERAQALKEAEAQHDAFLDMVKLAVQEESKAGDLLVNQNRIQSDAEMRGADILTRLITSLEQMKQNQQNQQGQQNEPGRTAGGAGRPPQGRNQ